jgi:hypothetical protein
MEHKESKIQQSIIKWFRFMHRDYIIYANANGGFRNLIEARIMKSEGVIAGVSDLTVIFLFFVIWVEVKTKTGRQTPLQKEFQNKVEKLGYHYFVVRSLEDFMKICNEFIYQKN